MFAYNAGRSLGKVTRTAIVPLLFIAAASGAGCATGNPPHYANAPAVAGYSKQAAADVQVEADGLPVQAAPSARIRDFPDDPSEPFSRNYGGPNPAVSVRAAIEAPVARANPKEASAIPADLPPMFRRQLAQAGYAVE